MIHDYFAWLKANPINDCINACALVSGFIDSHAVRSTFDKEKTRKYYLKKIKALEEKSIQLPEGINLEPSFSALSFPDWIGFEISFILQSPWYTKDDRAFHVLDNPVRKDRVFGVPYMPASSWKGLLRWACRMQTGLIGHLRENNMKLDNWNDQDWILRLFGNEKAETDVDKFRQGILCFYPTWFNKIGFEIINPHDRVRRAGTNPICYEVVPAETNGNLRILFAPNTAEEKASAKDDICMLLSAIKELLPKYGISAKRTAGWGTAKITNWKAYFRNEPVEANAADELWNKLKDMMNQETKCETINE